MKRWLTQTMAGLLLLGLMGCGGTPAAAPTPEVTPEPTPQQTPEAPTSASVLLTDVGNQMSLMTPADWPRYRAEEGNQVYYIYQGDTTQSTLFSISSYEASGLSRDEATIRSLAADPWAAYAQGYRENGVAMEGLTEWKAIQVGEDCHGLIREFGYHIGGQEVHGWYMMWNTAGRVYIATASALPQYEVLTAQTVEKALISFQSMED